ncbi:MAG: TraR/DksA C4-type zinc finger protein [Planctomycetota bacterium]
MAAPKPSQPAKSPELLLEEAMDQDWTKAKLRKVKTGLSRKDMNYFKALLKEKLIEIVGNIRGMETTRSDALSDIAHMPLHMADVGSDNFEQEFTLGLMEWERKIFADIKDALMRIEEGIYGVCLDSGRPINRARLEAKPWAKYCIEVARLREKRGW